MNEGRKHLFLRLLAYSCPQVISVLLHRLNSPEPVGVIPRAADPIVSTGQKHPDQEDKTQPAAVDNPFEFRTKDNRLARVIFFEVQLSYDSDKLRSLFIYLANGIEYYRRQEEDEIPVHTIVFTPSGNWYEQRIKKATENYAKIDPARFTVRSTAYPYFFFLNPGRLPVVASLKKLKRDPGIRAFAKKNTPTDTAIATAALAALIASAHADSREAAQVAVEAAKELNDPHLETNILLPVLMLHVNRAIMRELLPKDAPALDDSVRTIADEIYVEIKAKLEAEQEVIVQARVEERAQDLAQELAQAEVARIQAQAQDLAQAEVAKAQAQARTMLTGHILYVLTQKYQFDGARLNAATESLANITVERLDEVLKVLMSSEDLSPDELDALIGPERGSQHGGTE